MSIKIGERDVSARELEVVSEALAARNHMLQAINKSSDFPMHIWALIEEEARTCRALMAVFANAAALPPPSDAGAPHAE